MASRSILEEKATEVAKEMEPSMANSDPKKYGISFIAIIQIVMTILQTVVQNCPASAKEIAKSVKKPSIRQQAALLKECRNGCECCTPELNMRTRAYQMSESIKKVAAQMEDDELEQLVDEVRNTNMFL